MNSNGLPSCVVFDFDYTLADTTEGVMISINYALSQLGLPEAEADSIRRTIGMTMEEALVTLTDESNRHLAPEFFRLFVERGDEVMADATKLYEFVPDVLDTLRDANVAMGIVSTNLRRRIERVLRRDGLDDRFGAIMGFEDIAKPKPDPMGLLSVIEELGCQPAESIYVGDTATDAETARRADVPFVAALSGVTPRESFDGLSVLDVIPNASKIMSVLEKRAGVEHRSQSRSRY